MYQYTVIALSPSLSPELAVPLATFGRVKIARQGVSDGTRIYACSAGDAIDAGLIGRLPASVGLIAVAGSKTDRIDIEAARARGIKVSHIPQAARDAALSLKANIAAFIDRGFPLDAV